MPNPFRVTNLSRRRIWIAYGIAVSADALQFCLGPFGWAFIDQIIDLVAMVLISLAIGFHPLLLPTFIVEFIPLVDLLPTWTACVALVLKLRKPDLPAPPPTPPPRSANPDVIDV
jgi:hypothetical protein